MYDLEYSLHYYFFNSLRRWYLENFFFHQNVISMAVSWFVGTKGISGSEKKVEKLFISNMWITFYFCNVCVFWVDFWIWKIISDETEKCENCKNFWTYNRWYLDLWKEREALDLNVLSQLWHGNESPPMWVSMCLFMSPFSFTPLFPHCPQA